MKKKINKEKTAFFEFNQNNSGGYFDVNGNVCHRVIIEANNSEHAKEIFEPMIKDQSGSCPCCGDERPEPSPWPHRPRQPSSHLR